jgi:hypothetical protein
LQKQNQALLRELTLTQGQHYDADGRKHVLEALRAQTETLKSEGAWQKPPKPPKEIDELLTAALLEPEKTGT